MSPQKSTQYKAYSLATGTVAKTRQIVMLYDGAIRFVKQAEQAIAEKRIADRYNLLKRASDVMMGLQSSIDFEQGGEVAHTLQRYYLTLSTRMLAVNMQREGGEELCRGIVADLKKMRDVWDNIDQTMNEKSSDTAAPAPAATLDEPAAAGVKVAPASGEGRAFTLSA